MWGGEGWPVPGILVAMGATVLVASVLGLWSYGAVLFNEGQVGWAILAFLAGMFVIALAVFGVVKAQGWWGVYE